MMNIRHLARESLPPALFRFYHRKRLNHCRGRYASWALAAREARGYECTTILSAVQEATRKVVRGDAKYERDQILFNDDTKRWPLIGALLRQALATSSNGSLSVMDFGGSLGSTYYQIRDVIEDLVDLRWTIIEQKAFVEAGQKEFATSVLKFRGSVAECISEDKPNVALLSSVLPYVEDPYAVLEQVMASQVAAIVIDRTPLLDGPEDRLTVQHVPENLGGSSYPAWFLSRQKVEAAIEKGYRILSTFDGLDGDWHLEAPFEIAKSRGYVLVHKRQGL